MVSIALCMFVFQLVVVIEVALTNRIVFDSLGTSKGRWLAILMITLVMGLLVGFIATCIYCVSTRPKVKRQSREMLSLVM